MLRVTLQSKRLHFEQRDSAARPRVIDGFFRRAMNGEDVVAVDSHAAAAERVRFVGESARRGLFRDRRRIRVRVVFDHDDHRQLLHRGEVHAFVKRAGGRAAVADEGHRHEALLLHPAGEGDTGHHRDHVA